MDPTDPSVPPVQQSNSSIFVTDLRLSFVWFKSLFETAGKGTTSSSVLAAISRAAEYSKCFREMQEGKRTDGLGPPWPYPKGHYFWTHYLGNRVPGSVGTRDAWRSFVPFRRALDIGASTPKQPVWPVWEAFYYPFGTGLICTLRMKPHSSIEAAIDSVVAIRTQPSFRVPSLSTQLLRLDDVASNFMATVREQATGTRPPVGELVGTPLTTTTIVRGVGDPTMAILVDQGHLHRAVHALTTWSSSWNLDGLPPLIQCAITRTGIPPSHVLYVRKRARVVWFPLHFLGTAKPKKLACYHRNQVMAALQTEALLSLFGEVAEMTQNGTPLLPTQEDQIRIAAGLLARLYFGNEESTYRSATVKSQIDCDPRKGEVNKVRGQHGLPPI